MVSDSRPRCHLRALFYQSVLKSSVLSQLWRAGLIAIAFAACIATASAQERNFDPIPYEDRMRDFSLHDLQGVMHHSKDYRGKTLLVVFWTVNCQTCQADIAELEVAQRQLKDSGVEIIAIHAGDHIAAIKSLPGIGAVHYTILVDLELRLRDWGVPAIPTAYVVDANGYRRYRAVGARDWSSAAIINTLKQIAQHHNDN